MGITALLMVPFGIFIAYPVMCALDRFAARWRYLPLAGGLTIAFLAAVATAYDTVFHTAPAAVDCHTQYDQLLTHSVSGQALAAQRVTDNRGPNNAPKSSC